MKIDWLEDERARAAFEEAGEYEREHEASEGILHERQEFDPEKSHMDGYLQEEKDTASEDKMHEIYQMENAYGKITFGMNEKGETVLSVRRVKNNNGPSLPGVAKEVNPADTRHYIGTAGDKELNTKSPVSSAYAMVSRDREEDVQRFQGETLMRESEGFGKLTGQHALNTMLPIRTGDSEKDRQNYALHAKIASHLEMAMQENRAKMKNKDEAERAVVAQPAEKSTDTPDKPENPDEDEKCL